MEYSAAGIDFMKDYLEEQAVTSTWQPYMTWCIMDIIGLRPNVFFTWGYIA